MELFEEAINLLKEKEPIVIDTRVVNKIPKLRGDIYYEVMCEFNDKQQKMRV